MKILKFGLLFLLGIFISRDLSALTISLPYDTEGSVPIRKDLDIDYLIDGRYEEDKRDVTLLMRGSTNQKINRVIDRFCDEKEYDKAWSFCE